MTASESLFHFGSLPVKGRNNLLDRVFYDVSGLNVDEQAELSPLTDREGTVLLVYPTKARTKFDHFRNALQLYLHKRNEVEGIAVAGVGSSVLGTAALARNVADAIDAPVAGIVSGYGVSDLMAEALGGWFFFGAIDRNKYKAESLMAALSRGGSAAAADSTGETMKWSNAKLDGLPLQSDTTALLDLLEAGLPNLNWLVGHSKGCLLIDFVLERYARERADQPDPLYDRLNVVTLGAVVDLPNKFKKVTQVIGAIDSFGKLNSSLSVRHREVPGAWHHLNRDMPAHLDAVDVVSSVKNGKPIGASASQASWPLPRF